jgi:hypothetical protein
MCEKSYEQADAFTAKPTNPVDVLKEEVENLRESLNDVLDELEELQKLNSAFVTVIKNLLKD